MKYSSSVGLLFPILKTDQGALLVDGSGSPPDQLGLLDDEQWKVIEQRIQVSWDTCEMRPLYTRDDDTAFADYLATLKDNCDE